MLWDLHDRLSADIQRCLLPSAWLLFKGFYFFGSLPVSPLERSPLPAVELSSPAVGRLAGATLCSFPGLSGRNLPLCPVLVRRESFVIACITTCVILLETARACLVQLPPPLSSLCHPRRSAAVSTSPLIRLLFDYTNHPTQPSQSGHSFGFLDANLGRSTVQTCWIWTSGYSTNAFL